MSADGACTHDMLIRGLCVACGEDLSSERIDDDGAADPDGRAKLGGSGLDHVVPGLQMRNKGKYVEDDVHRMRQTRQLYLILDLDETLIHTVRGGPPPPHARMMQAAPPRARAAAPAAAPAAEAPAAAEAGEIAPAEASPPAAPDDEPDGRTVKMFVAATGQVVMMRPHARQFLKAMSALAQISLYTMGSEEYARAILAVLDPSRTIFRGGLCAWGDGVTRTRKNLDRLVAHREMSLVVDDTAEVWSHDWRSLLPVPRWTGEPTDDALLHVAEHVRRVHARVYGATAAAAPVAPPDARDVLAAVRPQFLAGCVFSFSGLFPRGTALDEHVVCRLVRACGGEVEDELSARTTHLIFRRERTEKIQRAMRMRELAGRPAVLWEAWLLACLSLWQLLPEGHMAHRADGAPRPAGATANGTDGAAPSHPAGAAAVPAAAGGAAANGAANASLSARPDVAAAVATSSGAKRPRAAAEDQDGRVDDDVTGARVSLAE